MNKYLAIILLALCAITVTPGFGMVTPPAALADHEGDYTGEGEDDDEAPPREDGEDNEPGNYYGGKSNRITPRDQLDCANRRCRQYCQGNFCATEEYNRCADSCLGD